jgi:fructose-bisphosphate aldolase class II
MPLVGLDEVLGPARAGGYAVGAFNVVNLEFLEAIVEAAEATRSPVILNIAEVHFPYVRLEHVCPAIRAMAAASPAPIVLNLDHGLTRGAIERALANGFTSVMIDASKLSFQENLRETKEIVEICRQRGVGVEGELGHVGGAEGGSAEGSADERLFTDPGQAAEYVERSGISALAVAIGNAHGRYRGEPRLDFARLEALRDAVGVPLVLHGGSGIPDEDFRRAISLGICKINFYTGMSEAALAALKAAVAGAGQRYNDYPEICDGVRKAVRSAVEAQMRVFGSAGKAVTANAAG